MSRTIQKFIALVLCLAPFAGVGATHSQLALAEENAATAAGEAASCDPVAPARPRDSRQMTARIDQLLAADWAAAAIKPPAAADDATFLRRVSLDLVGVVPTVGEVRAFLADRDPQKRARLIDRLLASHLHPDHLATTWRNMMVPRGAGVDEFDAQAGLQNWLQAQFAKNQRYDQLVADLMVASGGSQEGPGLFYTAFDLKPEELAANTSRIFLGVQMECAQCHDHPFDRWTQGDFWSYAAFFARIGRGGDMQMGRGARLVDKETGEVMLPGTGTVVGPRYPRGDTPSRDDTGTRREQLGIWMVSRDNPFVAPAAVNRAWAHLFGRGLVEPVDDLSERNPPSHPEVFRELSAYFIETSFDLRNLVRTLANTQAYQAASVTGEDDPPADAFAWMLVKTLTPEQFYDSLMRSSLSATGISNAPTRQNLGSFDVARQTFVAKMQSPSASRLDYDAGVAQVLLLLNGPEVTSATSRPTSGLLAALDAPVLSDRERVEILFLATLAREPREQELLQSLARLTRAAADNIERSTALGDILWALYNSAEFSLNH
ncbi:MAG TPA: DUF1549 domain-containing protein [Pirellulales bacterium]|jgi:hypothetical protein